MQQYEFKAYDLSGDIVSGIEKLQAERWELLLLLEQRGENTYRFLFRRATKLILM